MTDAIQKAREALETALNSIGDLIVVNGQVSWTAVARIQDELMRDVTALAALDAETEVKVLHGPYGWLIKPHGYLLKPIGLNEEYWTLSTEPSEFPADVVSVPLFAREPQMPGDEAPEKRVATVGQEWLIARLKEALKPLAQYADWYERIYGVNCDDGREVPCRMAHLRRARDVSSHVPALDAETEVTPADVGEEPAAYYWTEGHMSPDTPMGPAEYDEEVVFGFDKPVGVECEPLYSAPALERVTRERDALRARLETVEAETRERLSNELDPEIGFPSDSLLRSIHADLEMRGRKHPDFAVTVHHRNIVLSAVAAALRNPESRHD